MTNSVNIACLQTSPLPDFASALDHALTLAKSAADSGAQFLALPEYCGGLQTKGSSFAPPFAPEDEHPVLNGLRAFASSRKVWLSIGSLAVSAMGSKFANRSFVVDDQGQIVSRYDKIHLFDISLSDKEVYLESATVQGGDSAVITQTPFGAIGHSICYDLRFAALYRQLAQAGADILMVPAAFTKKTGEAHWHVLNRARAIENGAFVVASCAIGDVEGGGGSYGHSLIVDPWGEVLADGGEEPGVVLATLDLDLVAETRRKIPSLEHGRPFSAPDPVK